MHLYLGMRVRVRTRVKESMFCSSIIFEFYLSIMTKQFIPYVVSLFLTLQYPHAFLTTFQFLIFSTYKLIFTVENIRFTGSQ